MTKEKIENALYRGKIPEFPLNKFQWTKALSRHIQLCHDLLGKSEFNEFDFRLVDRQKGSAKPTS